MPVAAGLSGTAVKRILVSGGTVYAGVIDTVGNSVVYTASESSVAAGTAVWALFGTGNLGPNRVTGLVLVSGQLLAIRAYRACFDTSASATADSRIAARIINAMSGGVWNRSFFSTSPMSWIKLP